MSAVMPLALRIKVDNELFLEAGIALTKMQAGMQDNHTPLPPNRRADLFKIIALAQGPE